MQDSFSRKKWHPVRLRRRRYSYREFQSSHIPRVRRRNGLGRETPFANNFSDTIRSPRVPRIDGINDHNDRVRREQYDHSGTVYPCLGRFVRQLDMPPLPIYGEPTGPELFISY